MFQLLANGVSDAGGFAVEAGHAFQFGSVTNRYGLPSNWTAAIMPVRARTPAGRRHGDHVRLPAGLRSPVMSTFGEAGQFGYVLDATCVPFTYMTLASSALIRRLACVTPAAW